jgi:hypothetical protein
MSPKMACRLFWAGAFLVAETEANPKAMQDQLPDVLHKSFKKRQVGLGEHGSAADLRHFLYL